jgi:MFS family permease
VSRPGTTSVGQDKPGSRCAYPILLALACLDSIGYSVIGPVLPALAHKTHSGPVVAGMIVASFPFAMLLGFFPAGGIVRRLGAKGTLMLALGIIAAGTAGFVASDGIVAYTVSRSLMGVGSGGLWIGVTLGTLERWPDEGYVRVSRVFAGYSIGGLLGPALGALGGTRKPFLAYIALVAVSAVLVARLPPPRQPQAFRADRSELRRPGLGSGSLPSGSPFPTLVPVSWTGHSRCTSLSISHRQRSGASTQALVSFSASVPCSLESSAFASRCRLVSCS